MPVGWRRVSAELVSRIAERAGALGLGPATPVVAMLSGGADSTLLVVTLAELGCAVRWEDRSVADPSTTITSPYEVTVLSCSGQLYWR